MNFPDEESRNNAATLINDRVGGAVVEKIKKLQPKIMICNVHGEEDDVVEAVIEKNAFLRSISDVESKMNLLFKKPAAGQTAHYIIKCHPEVCKAIHDHGNKLSLRWGIYQVRDRYYITTCFHCQRYGHISDKCNFKDDSVICGICAGAHETRNCSSDSHK